ncbi:TPM domain-containing protein [Phaeodactylibacter luteus]|uniref:TPM domain-containing protein n=1 Tax=Phaeodactylibacter luteus TaxID=1564516 RepID=A0A5C6RMB6_9BACT|nr:TPM domain-containing protein [Phaeodactylibacter luteus]TXB63377.1 TPM domain-containing protein [Phaeodactylibacter luteus]
MARNFILYLFCLLPLFAIGQKTYTIESAPNPKSSGNGYVSDPDNFLSAEDEATLNRLCAELEQSSTAQVAIVVLGSIGSENPKDFGTRLFNHWGIGQADVDNGLLILSVMDQRRTEFETGYGMEAVLPDILCYRIGMQELVPYFREGQYGQGLIAATAEIKRLLENPDALAEIRSQPSRRKSYSQRMGFLALWLAINLIFHLFLTGYLIYSRFSKQRIYDRHQMVYKMYRWWLIIPFPLPYLLFYLGMRYWLRKLRDMPRYSPKNGKLMHKLTEEEEDQYLELGQVVEEAIRSIDYDVWATENYDDILILPYQRRWSGYSACPKCSYRTYSKTDTVVLRHATTSSTGLRQNTYVCKNCNYSRKETVVIPKVSTSSGGSSSGGGGGGSSFGGGSSGGGGGGVSW